MTKIKFLSILNATSLHEGGGLNILNRFKVLKFDKIYFDSRFKNFFINFYLYKLFLEFFFLITSNKNTKITYLSGTPPIFKTSSYILCCFQNSNIFFSEHKNFFDWLFSKDLVRYLFFSFFKNNVDLWVTFSPYAKDLLLKNNIAEYKIKIINIFSVINKKKLVKKKIYDFIYPAVLLPHKNHINLIKALIILANKGLYPKVLLTLNNKEVLKSNFLKTIDKFKLQVTFKYYHNSITRAYRSSWALIYPSLTETFGLPILEAFENHLQIITSDRPYAIQFLQPTLVFDPKNPLDISNKIRKFMINKNTLNKNIVKTNKNNYLSLNESKKIFL